MATARRRSLKPIWGYAGPIEVGMTFMVNDEPGLARIEGIYLHGDCEPSLRVSICGGPGNRFYTPWVSEFRTVARLNKYRSRP